MESEAGKTHSPSLQMGGGTPQGCFLSFKIILNSEKWSVFSVIIWQNLLKYYVDIWQEFVLNPEETYAIIT